MAQFSSEENYSEEGFDDSYHYTDENSPNNGLYQPYQDNGQEELAESYSVGDDLYDTHDDKDIHINNTLYDEENNGYQPLNSNSHSL